MLLAGLSTLLPAQERTVYVGTYTSGASKGIRHKLNAIAPNVSENR